ncbi:pseudouridine synthase [Parvibium lacunae]|uniref:Dual-specificity RNA pseudouridine synthase RluF n=1 Tax=Parvibium lacunae TaxID=1888893 RepID=A0A368L7S9_9BURK|nr:rRNA pseudouridine synthase [Parvibium lacunae]
MSAPEKPRKTLRLQGQPARTKPAQTGHQVRGRALPHQRRRDAIAAPRQTAVPERPAIAGRAAVTVAAADAAGDLVTQSPPTVAIDQAPGVSLQRLSKLMAQRGLCSRREADEYIENGWVTVNGLVVKTLGTKVPEAVEIGLLPAAQRTQGERVTILLHKPIGYVSGQAEDGYEPASVLIVPERLYHPGTEAQRHFKPQHARGLAPAGRLDIDSTGLLVLTQDGRIARQLIDADSTIDKEYLVRVSGRLSAVGLAQLNHGLSLDGIRLKPAQVSWQNENQLRFVLQEGRKRQIRRMCELVGLRVIGLKRVRIGKITLADLPLGAWRYLRPEESFG